MSDEIVLTGWRKSRRSFSNGGCVEVGQGPTVVGVRDSKNPSSPVLVFGGSTWGRFVAALKTGGVGH